MRLINVNTLVLQSPQQEQLKYAILSHRWRNEEVKFETFSAAQKAIQEHRTQGTPDSTVSGISKIAGACEICRQLKIDYLWIDTCCIDKRSSTEESEAINSMFKWYQEAEICLTFMDDVGENARSFSQSEWFTRGWTLQELLAPRKIVFLDQMWNQIGTKTSLSAQIATATRISRQHLQDFRQASIATKLSWQAGRATTRTEDIAYSMFGLFDVAMDLRYGEGNRAFRRLQEEIIYRNPEDESILAWTLNDPTPGGVLAPTVDCFRGCGHLIVTGQSADYRPRAEYRLSGRGFEITAPTSKAAVATKIGFGYNAGTGSKIELTLNCWDASKHTRNTVVLMLARDRQGLFQRTNRKQLDWASNTRRLKDVTAARLIFAGGANNPTMSMPIVMQL